MQALMVNGSCRSELVTIASWHWPDERLHRVAKIRIMIAPVSTDLSATIRPVCNYPYTFFGQIEIWYPRTSAQRANNLKLGHSEPRSIF